MPHSAPTEWQVFDRGRPHQGPVLPSLTHLEVATMATQVVCTHAEALPPQLLTVPLGSS